MVINKFVYFKFLRKKKQRYFFKNIQSYNINTILFYNLSNKNLEKNKNYFFKISRNVVKSLIKNNKGNLIFLYSLNKKKIVQYYTKNDILYYFSNKKYVINNNFFFIVDKLKLYYLICILFLFNKLIIKFIKYFFAKYVQSHLILFNLKILYLVKLIDKKC